MVVVSMGGDGAMFVRANEALIARPPQVDIKSTSVPVMRWSPAWWQSFAKPAVGVVTPAWEPRFHWVRLPILS